MVTKEPKVFITKRLFVSAFSKYGGAYMLSAFKKDGPVMVIVELAVELDRYKKAYEKLKGENELLRNLIQIKRPFEVKV